MKKLLLLMMLAVAAVFGAHAASTWTFNINVDDPSKVVAQLTDGSSVIETLSLQAGDNKISKNITATSYLEIKGVDGYVVKSSDNAGDTWKTGDYKKYLSSWYDDEVSVKITAVLESEYRTHKVKVTVDSPDDVTLKLKGGSEFTPAAKEFELAYSPEDETSLEISHKSYSGYIYKITADGVEVQKEYGSYTVNLVDKTTDTPTYVQHVDIAVNFPEGMEYTVKIVLPNANPESITKVTYNSEEITDFAATDGFKVIPGKELKIYLDTENYKLAKLTVNGESRSTYYETITEDAVVSDMTYEITMTKYETFSFKFVTDCPEGVIVSDGDYWNPVYTDLQKGETVATAIAGKSDEFKIEANEGYELLSVMDTNLASRKDYTEEIRNGYVYVTAVAGSVIKIEASKIVYEHEAIFYLDDDTNCQPYLSCGTAKLTLKAGYNTFGFREQDKNITCGGARVPAENFKFYRNGQAVEVSYPNSFTITDAKNGEVHKLFLNAENAVEHTVTFVDSKNYLDGCTVKKDVIADVDPTAPVAAVGKTLFTIAPKAKDAAFKVTVDGKEIQPEDGVYSFETSANAKVEVTGPSGIESVTVEAAACGVYNLQGIRVADSLDNLPEGIYIVAGKKVYVK